MATAKAPPPAARPEPPNKAGAFAGFVTLITSAGVAVGAVFGLFNSVFASLVPPVAYKSATLGWLSLCGLVFLLALSVLFTSIRGRTLPISAAALSLLLVLCSMATYVFYASDLRSHVFQVPPPPAESDQRYLHGEVHVEGRRRLGAMSIDSFASKDLDAVLNSDVLWTKQSREEVSARIEARYVALVTLMLAAIFTSGVCLWTLPRFQRAQHVQQEART